VFPGFSQVQYESSAKLRFALFVFIGNHSTPHTNAERKTPWVWLWIVFATMHKNVACVARFAFTMFHLRWSTEGILIPVYNPPCKLKILGMSAGEIVRMTVHISFINDIICQPILVRFINQYEITHMSYFINWCFKYISHVWIWNGSKLWQNKRHSWHMAVKWETIQSRIAAFPFVLKAKDKKKFIKRERH